MARAGGRYYDENDTAILSLPPGSATTYYVKPTGNNGSNGTSWATAWQTLGKAFDRYGIMKSAGDTVLIGAGTYYERLIVSSNEGHGTSSNYISVGPYGNGEVIIEYSLSGEGDIGSWTQNALDANVYQATVTNGETVGAIVVDDDFKSYHPAGNASGTDDSGSDDKATSAVDTAEDYNGYESAIFFNTTDGSSGLVTSITTTTNTDDTINFSGGLSGGTDNDVDIGDTFIVAALDTAGNWYQETTGDILYVNTSADDLDDNDIIITENDGDSSSAYGATIQHRNYWKFYGLTIRGSPALGIFIDAYAGNGNYIIVEQCKISHHAKSGVLFEGSNNQLTKCKIYGNVIRNWPRGNNAYCVSGGGWAGSIRLGSYDVASGNIVFDGGGEGILSYGGGGNNTYEDNIVYDNLSVNIYTDNQPDAIIRRNFIYSSGINATDVQVQGCTGAQQASMTRRLRPEGIMTADENYGYTPPANYTGGKIYNNVILSCRRGITHYGQATGSAQKNTDIFENIIIMPNFDESTYSDTYYAIQNSSADSDSAFYNNILIGQHAASELVNAGTTASDMNNNLYYHPNNATPLKWSGTNYNFTDWKTQSGEDANSLNTDPTLTRSDWTGYD